MKFLPWEHLEDTATGKDLSDESRLTWFRSACRGWRIVPDDIKIIPYGKNNEKIACVMVVSIFDEKGRKMASYPHSGVFNGEDAEGMYDQGFASTIFDVAVDEALTMLGFTAKNALIMQRQAALGSGTAPSEQPPARPEQTDPAPKNEPVQVRGAAPDVTGNFKDRLNLVFTLAKNKGLLKKIDSVEMYADKVLGIREITENNCREVEMELTKSIQSLKGKGGA
jgi:hypothetical protein